MKKAPGNSEPGNRLSVRMKVCGRLTAFVLLAAMLAAGCSRAFEPDVQTGAQPMMTEEGHPEFHISSLSFFEDEQPVIQVVADIVKGSLIYTTHDELYEAGAEVEFQLYRITGNENEQRELVQTASRSAEISDEDSSLPHTHNTLRVEQHFDVTPGRYQVMVQVTDVESGNAVQVSDNTVVEDPQGDTPVLTQVRLLGRELEGIPSTVATYHVPGRKDSLSFEYQVSRHADHPPVSLMMRLIRFESDMEIPRSLSAQTPRSGSMAYRGINYNQQEVLEEQTRELAQESGNITIEYETGLPDRGNYRFEVTMKTQGEEGGDDEQLKARDFAVTSEYFPSVQTFREMARPLAYLMNRREHDEMMAIEDQDSLKQAMDSFWFENIGDTDRARDVIERYYTRVEEANKQFTSFKEGWMTDRGMLYVLFGPPFHVDRRLNHIIWYYDYNRQNPERRFVFERTRMDTDDRPFDHYVLQRDPGYHSIQYRQIQRWLSGRILERPI